MRTLGRNMAWLLRKLSTGEGSIPEKEQRVWTNFIMRYEAFEQYAQALEKKTGKKVRIAIAHHKDDIAETMMMNLFRGSGLDGLVNPKPVAGRIIRPLLCLKKSELVDYLDTLGVEYAIDKTNLQAVGTRNTWRNEFLPKIGEFYNEDPTVPLARTYNSKVYIGLCHVGT